MAENNRESESIARQKSDQAPKKLYEPPKVVSHQVMEVVASACTSGNVKTHPLEAGCASFAS